MNPIPVMCAVLCLAQFHNLMAQDLGKTGEKWIYQVEGPRPMSNPPVAVEGDRVDEVVSITGEGAELRRQVKTTWGKGDENTSLVTLDAQYRIQRVEVGTSLTIEFTPPVPGLWADLNAGESTTFESKLTVMGFEMPLKYEVKRLEDEKVTVPAGTYAGCRHIQMLVHSSDPSGQPNKTRYDQWVDFNGHGLIKEIVVTNYQTDNSQRTLSSLKEHIVPR